MELNSTAWGAFAAAVVGITSAVIAYMTNKRQDKSTNRSQALVEVQAVWERLDEVEEKLDKERVSRESERAELEKRLDGERSAREKERDANAKWRRTAVTYINKLTAAWGSGGPIPMLPDDLDLD